MTAWVSLEKLISKWCTLLIAIRQKHLKNTVCSMFKHTNMMLLKPTTNSLALKKDPVSFMNSKQDKHLKPSHSGGSTPPSDCVLQSDSTGSCVRSWIIQTGCVNDTIYVCLTELVVSPATGRLCQQVGSNYPFTSPLWRPRPLSQDAQKCETCSRSEAAETWPELDPCTQDWRKRRSEPFICI